MDVSSLITYAIPFFLLLIVFEFFYGVIKKENNYRLNDTLTSMSLGLISRFVPLLGLGFQYVVYKYVTEYYNLKLLNMEDAWVWIVSFLLYDVCYYWMHRMHHEIKVFWATHVVHHHGEEFNLSTALRQTSSGFLWKWIFFLPMFVIGVPPEVYVSVAGVNLVYQFWVHTEHVGRLGFLEYIFITPSNHRIHHAQNDDYLDANYGGVFILWDRIFGTFIDEREDLKPIYGTVKPLKSFNPFWANIEVFYQMILDSYRTKKLRDKVYVWFSPPAWRPDDVAKKYPLEKNDLNNFKKHNPQIGDREKMFGFFQFAMINALTILMLFNIDFYLLESNYSEMLSIVAMVITLALSNSFMLDGKKYANKVEIVRLSGVLIFLYLGFFTNLIYLILAHTLIALTVVLFVLKNDSYKLR
jgi:sterol desaturase/sphingolipid hydroxylase (fatty acid hydroxylase superfamily)|tara:strand:+ start:271 stop:1506 length:1236 start_codon:yes stop_codon:yes gene_type:complete